MTSPHTAASGWGGGACCYSPSNHTMTQAMQWPPPPIWFSGAAPRPFPEAGPGMCLKYAAVGCAKSSNVFGSLNIYMWVCRRESGIVNIHIYISVCVLWESEREKGEGAYARGCVCVHIHINRRPLRSIDFNNLEPYKRRKGNTSFFSTCLTSV